MLWHGHLRVQGLGFWVLDLGLVFGLVWCLGFRVWGLGGIGMSPRLMRIQHIDHSYHLPFDLAYATLGILYVRGWGGSNIEARGCADTVVSLAFPPSRIWEFSPNQGYVWGGHCYIKDYIIILGPPIWETIISFEFGVSTDDSQAREIAQCE